MKIFTHSQRLLANIPADLKRRIGLTLLFVILLNVFVWISIFVYAQYYPILLGLATIAFGLGLRHAVDADHIAAIDNTTRKLMQEGKQPVAIGLFFSLGHSSVVILLTAAIAFSASYINQNLPQYKQIGSLIGTTVSCVFLLIIGIINLVVFIDLFKIWRHVVKHGKFTESHIDHHLHNRGLLARLFRPIMLAVSSSWSMYPVGFLFGLGFDTASEVALLSLSAASTARSIPVGAIMLLPLVFTAGMSLIDTLDGILMLGAYGWATIKPVRKLYYNLNITFISVVIALFIGGIEGLQVISSQTGWDGGIFALANKVEFDSLGYFIIGAFILSWLFSALIYRFRKYDLLDSLDHDHR